MNIWPELKKKTAKSGFSIETCICVKMVKMPILWFFAYFEKFLSLFFTESLDWNELDWNNKQNSGSQVTDQYAISQLDYRILKEAILRMNWLYLGNKLMN